MKSQIDYKESEVNTGWTHSTNSCQTDRGQSPPLCNQNTVSVRRLYQQLGKSPHYGISCDRPENIPF